MEAAREAFNACSAANELSHHLIETLAIKLQAVACLRAALSIIGTNDTQRVVSMVVCARARYMLLVCSVRAENGGQARYDAAKTYLTCGKWIYVWVLVCVCICACVCFVHHPIFNTYTHTHQPVSEDEERDEERAVTLLKFAEENAQSIDASKDKLGFRSVIPRLATMLRKQWHTEKEERQREALKGQPTTTDNPPL